MTLWFVRILSFAWAGFWFWFGVAEAIQDKLPWQRIALYGLRPGLIFLALAVIAWRWPRIGAALLNLTGFALAVWYAVNFGHMPTATKLFTLGTFAFPPLLCGLVLAYQRPKNPSA